MATRSERDKSKAAQEKHQAILAQLLKEEDNKYCVDCDAKGPRWASWNLGVFLCIRCAGIHRNLGVHISKVKSVNLDTWTQEQLAMVQEMGNSRARAVYEANLPDHFRRPQTDSTLEAFIRAKYEQKKYIAKEWVPPQPKFQPMPEERREKKKTRPRPGTGTNLQLAGPNRPISTSRPESRTIHTASNAASAAAPPKPAPAKKKETNIDDLIGLEASVAAPASSSSSNDLFGVFMGATTTTTSTTSSSSTGPSGTADSSSAQPPAAGSDGLEDSLFGGGGSGGSSGEPPKSTKDSIMALYGSNSGQQQNFGVPGGMYMNQQAGQPQQQMNMMAAAGMPNAGMPNTGMPNAGMPNSAGMPNGMQNGMQNGIMPGTAPMMNNMAGVNMGMMGIPQANNMVPQGMPAPNLMVVDPNVELRMNLNQNYLYSGGYTNQTTENKVDHKNPPPNRDNTSSSDPLTASITMPKTISVPPISTNMPNPIPPPISSQCSTTMPSLVTTPSSRENTPNTISLPATQVPQTSVDVALSLPSQDSVASANTEQDAAVDKTGNNTDIDPLSEEKTAESLQSTNPPPAPTILSLAAKSTTSLPLPNYDALAELRNNVFQPSVFSNSTLHSIAVNWGQNGRSPTENTTQSEISSDSSSFALAPTPGDGSDMPQKEPPQQTSEHQLNPAASTHSESLNIWNSQDIANQFPTSINWSQSTVDKNISGQTFSQGFPGQSLGQGFPGQNQGQGFPGQSQGQGFPGQSQSQGFPGQNQCQSVPAQIQGQGFPGQNQSQGFPGQNQGQGFPGQKQGQSFPAQSEGQGFPGQNQGQRFPGQGEGQRFPAQSQGQAFPGQSQTQGFPGQSQGQGFPGQKQGQSFPAQSQGQGFPAQIQGQSFPGQSQGQSFPGQSQGQGFPGQSQGQNFPAQSQGQGLPGQSQVQGFPAQSQSQGLPGQSQGQHFSGFAHTQGMAYGTSRTDTPVFGKMAVGADSVHQRAGSPYTAFPPTYHVPGPPPHSLDGPALTENNYNDKLGQMMMGQMGGMPNMQTGHMMAMPPQQAAAGHMGGGGQQVPAYSMAGQGMFSMQAPPQPSVLANNQFQQLANQMAGMSVGGSPQMGGYQTAGGAGGSHWAAAAPQPGQTLSTNLWQ